MRVAFTADVHLASGGDHPERLAALDDILGRLEEEGVATLVIAGDLFDSGVTNPAEMESLCHRHHGTEIHIIPGNHDPGLNSRLFSASNVTVHNRPTTYRLAGVKFLFVPYRDGTTMGEAMADQAERLRRERWFLVGHGDYYGGLRARNPYERGTYMPLTRADLRRFNPERAILGHIHEPVEGEEGRVIYPGSPCGMDITETGRRRFVVLRPETGEVRSVSVDSKVLFFNERFVCMPGREGLDKLRRNLVERVSAWSLSPRERAKVRLRVKVSGFTSDRSAVGEILQKELGGFRLYDEEYDLSELHLSEDERLETISSRVRKELKTLAEEVGVDYQEALESALLTIYGEGS